VTQAQCKVGMISNPNSGHNRNQFESIQRRVAACDAIHHVITHDASEITSALAELSEKRIDVLAINGGDGTASAILGHMLENPTSDSLPLIVLLPGGTANMNAGDIGIKGSLPRAVEKFCRWCEDGQPQKPQETRQLMRIEAEQGEVQYSMFIGGGAIIHGTEYAHREIHSRGLRDDFSLILGTIRTVWGVLRNDPEFNRHVSVGIRLDEGPEQQFDTLILAISTLQRLSFGMRPFWSNAPGNVRVTVMEQGCTKFARTFFSIIRGKPNRNAVAESGYRSFNADKVELDIHGPLNLDGEIIQCAGRQKISASAALQFLQL
jgi:diacylglycerol kinase (ATP)